MPTQKKFRDSIHAKGTEIAVLSTGDSNDYISLTDIARYKSDAPDDVIKNWMRNRDTIEFLGLWEQLNNPDFKPVEFDGFRTQAGSNAFTMSPKKWVEATGAIGIVSKAGRYQNEFMTRWTVGRRFFLRKELLRPCLFFSEFRTQLRFHTMMYRVYMSLKMTARRQSPF